MIKLYYHPSPNPAKIALFLEEAGLPYEMVPVDTRKGDQFKPDFLAINPNAKTPALTDGDVTIFDSNAILLYLAEKTGQFLPEHTPKARGEMLSWLMFVATGIGPYCGQAVHFSRFAPEKLHYAINRYAREAERHWGIVNDLLASRRYMLGDRYTLVDMSIWGWATRLSFAIGETWPEMLPHVKRHLDEISARPAAQRAVALKDQFAFKTDFDAEARKFLFPQNAHLAG
ncbi:glutathione S-transferase family protein [Bosea beijingensis]|uniref:glutathione S-transferase family protein n=1 Tax=Bosea beijingensis TaxID=3068632 RepID=UPI0027429472|nr:glutathione S-transferase N-terminal domain-containing protein [Bosea sp. REN20]